MNTTPKDLAPSITIRGTAFVMVVLLVKSRDEHGRPKACEFMYDNDATMTTKPEFVTVFAPKT